MNEREKQPLQGLFYCGGAPGGAETLSVQAARIYVGLRQLPPVFLQADGQQRVQDTAYPQMLSVFAGGMYTV